MPIVTTIVGFSGVLSPSLTLLLVMVVLVLVIVAV